MRRRFACLIAVASCLGTIPLSRAHAQASPSEQLQVGPPPTRRIESPPPDATAEDLEKRGDELRSEKAYPDALDYFRAALVKKPNSPQIYNKMGIVQLQSYHLPEAKKSFERALKLDKKYPDAYNNLGVTYYSMKKFGKAIKLYTKAIDIREDSASYFSNLGSAYFAQKQFDRASLAYTKALQLDPEIFEHTSRTGVTAHLPSPEDRAHYDFVMAKLYAKMGLVERSLQYLRRAMEDGYKEINLVYKEAEFSDLRKDPRFSELMAAKPPAIPN